MNLGGIYAASLTASTKNNQLDEKKQRDIIQLTLKQPIDGIFVAGTASEFFLLTPQERERILHLYAEHAKGKVKLIAQVGVLDMHEAVKLCKLAEKLGYDCLSAIPPFYYNFKFPEIQTYYNTLLKATDLPFMIYQAPEFSGVDLDLEKFSVLLKPEQMIGVKFTDTNIELFERLCRHFPKKCLLNGEDIIALPAYSVGGNGIIALLGCVAGHKYRQLFDLFKAGNFPAALKIQQDISDVMATLPLTGYFQGLKVLLEMQGINAGLSRQPLSTPQEKAIAQLKKVATKLLK